MPGTRWVVGVGALLLASVAVFVLLTWNGSDDGGPGPSHEGAAPPLDDIDARSRAALRQLLRESGGE